MHKVLSIPPVAMGRSTPQRGEKPSSALATVWGFLEEGQCWAAFLSPNSEDNFHPRLGHYLQKVQLLRFTRRIFETVNNKIFINPSTADYGFLFLEDTVQAASFYVQG